MKAGCSARETTCLPGYMPCAPLVSSLPFESLHAHLAIAKGIVTPTIGCASKYGVPCANPAPSQSALSSACRRVEVARMGSPSLHFCSLFASNQALGSGLIVFRLSRTLDATAAFCAL